MNNGDSDKNDRRAAIVCSHVHTDHFPILRAARDEPTMPEDSGWQFSCDTVENEDPDGAKVWLIYEILHHDPSLSPYIDYPPGTVLRKAGPTGSWEVIERGE